jgi:hypothetical protein
MKLLNKVCRFTRGIATLVTGRIKLPIREKYCFMHVLHNYYLQRVK